MSGCDGTPIRVAAPFAINRDAGNGLPVSVTATGFALSRITSDTRDGSLAESYAYDANGNRIAYRAPLRGITGTVTSTFDAEDRCITSGSETLTFTPDGYISSRTSSGLTISYAYTALGELSGGLWD